MRTHETPGPHFFALTIALILLGITLKQWLPFFLRIIGVIGRETELLQGIEAVVQLALILFGGISLIYGWMLRQRLPQKVATPPQVIVVSDKQKLDENFFRQVMGQAHPAEELRQATQRYLEYLVDRYSYLDFKGMGIADRVPLRLEFRDLYVPLKARIELPPGETWKRDLLLAGRKMAAHEQEHLAERLSEPKPLSDLLQQHNGLIILGDPGAGKTTFLKFSLCNWPPAAALKRACRFSCRSRLMRMPWPSAICAWMILLPAIFTIWDWICPPATCCGKRSNKAAPWSCSTA
jgi:hypothetical protein